MECTEVLIDGCGPSLEQTVTPFAPRLIFTVRSVLRRVFYLRLSRPSEDGRGI